jgi:hypothetical protein
LLNHSISEVEDFLVVHPSRITVIHKENLPQRSEFKHSVFD